MAGIILGAGDTGKQTKNLMEFTCIIVLRIRDDKLVR